MTEQAIPPGIELQQRWPRRVRSAMLHVVALAEYAVRTPEAVLV